MSGRKDLQVGAIKTVTLKPKQNYVINLVDQKGTVVKQIMMNQNGRMRLMRKQK